MRVPIHGPYHASHLYDARDINRIMESWPQEEFASYTPQIPTLSSETGKVFQLESLEELLKVSLEEILLRQLCWDKIIDSCASTLAAAPAKCTLLPI